MSKPITFVLSDESLNSYGTRVLTAGIDLSLFIKNPIALWAHNRASSYDGKGDILPIGKWVNVRIEGTKLLADIEFDEKDEFAQQIKNKVEQGIINMASIGADIITTSDDKKNLLYGQIRPTIVECLLKEASLCDIGANRNAIRLYDANLLLSDDNMNDNHFLSLLEKEKTPPTNNDKDKSMELRDSLRSTLNMSDSTDDDMLKHVGSLQKQVNDNKEKEQLQLMASIATLVDSAIKARKITESQRVAYISLAEKDFDNTKLILDSLNGVAELSDTGEDKTPSKSAWDVRNDEINENNKNK